MSSRVVWFVTTRRSTGLAHSPEAVGPPLRDSAGLSPDFVSVPRRHHSRAINCEMSSPLPTTHLAGAMSHCEQRGVHLAGANQLGDLDPLDRLVGLVD